MGGLSDGNAPVGQPGSPVTGGQVTGNQVTPGRTAGKQGGQQPLRPLHPITPHGEEQETFGVKTIIARLKKAVSKNEDKDVDEETMKKMWRLINVLSDQKILGMKGILRESARAELVKELMEKDIDAIEPKPNETELAKAAANALGQLLKSMETFSGKEKKKFLEAVDYMGKKPPDEDKAKEALKNALETIPERKRALLAGFCELCARFDTEQAKRETEPLTLDSILMVYTPDFLPEPGKSKKKVDPRTAAEAAAAQVKNAKGVLRLLVIHRNELIVVKKRE